MGENEQGGMLRTVVVVGLVALIAVVITMGVVGMKASLRTNTLMGLTMGQNVLTIDQSDVGKRFNVLGGNEKLSYDADSGIYIPLFCPQNLDMILVQNVANKVCIMAIQMNLEHMISSNLATNII